MRKRLVVLVGGIYVLAALVGHARERSGAVSCKCSDECCVNSRRWRCSVGSRRSVTAGSHCASRWVLDDELRADLVAKRVIVGPDE